MIKIITLQDYDSTNIINVETGSFSRYRQNEGFFVLESKSWLCEGVVIVNNFGHYTFTLSLTEFFDKLMYNKSDLFYKNGKPKFRIIDNDYGTPRIQGKQYKTYEVFAIFGNNDFFKNYKGKVF